LKIDCNQAFKLTKSTIYYGAIAFCDSWANGIGDIKAAANLAANIS